MWPTSIHWSTLFDRWTATRVILLFVASFRVRWFFTIVSSIRNHLPDLGQSNSNAGNNFLFGSDTLETSLPRSPRTFYQLTGDPRSSTSFVCWKNRIVVKNNDQRRNSQHRWCLSLIGRCSCRRRWIYRGDCFVCPRSVNRWRESNRISKWYRRRMIERC